MQRGGELAGLEGGVSLWRTERTYVFAAPSRGRRSNDSGRIASEAARKCDPGRIGAVLGTHSICRAAE
eukprot:scaffold109504_cov27-Phaeocystis_antarctica.AAC.1